MPFSESSRVEKKGKDDTLRLRMNENLSIKSPNSQPLETLYEAVAEAQRLFLRGLESPAGEKARRHLYQERRLPQELIAREGFGYVPPGWGTVTIHLVKSGIPLEAAAEAGLVMRSVGRTRKAFTARMGKEPTSSEELTSFFFEHCAGNPEFYYDYPLCYMADGSRQSGDWLTIPLRVRAPDGQLRIAGFQYRTMRPADEVVKQGRYMSPPGASRLISWSEFIIGLVDQEEAMRRSGKVIICEGKFDQAAVLAAVSRLPEDRRPGVVALAGVAIRGATGSSPEERAGIFRQLAVGQATFFLDDDETGTNAVLTAGPLLEALGTRVSVARIETDGIKDPGELYAQAGADAVLAVLERARNRGLVTHALAVLDRALDQNPMSGQVWRRQQEIDRLLPILKVLPEPVRTRALERCVEQTGIGYGVFEIGLALQDDGVLARRVSAGKCPERRRRR